MSDDELANSVAALSSSIGSLQDKMSALVFDPDYGIKRLGDRINSLNSRLEDMNSTLKELDNTLKRLVPILSMLAQKKAF